MSIYRCALLFSYSYSFSEDPSLLVVPMGAWLSEFGKVWETVYYILSLEFLLELLVFEP